MIFDAREKFIPPLRRHIVFDEENGVQMIRHHHKPAQPDIRPNLSCPQSFLLHYAAHVV